MQRLTAIDRGVDAVVMHQAGDGVGSVAVIGGADAAELLIGNAAGCDAPDRLGVRCSGERSAQADGAAGNAADANGFNGAIR